MKTRSIGQDAALLPTSEHGGNALENSNLGEAFSQVLKDLLGTRSPAGMYGATVNPMEFAPAPVGTELKAPEVVEVPEAEVEQEVVADDTNEEDTQEEVEVEEVEECEAVCMEAVEAEIEVEVVEVQVEAVAEEIVEEVIAEVIPTDGMVEEVVLKDSAEGQGMPDTQTMGAAVTDEQLRQRVIGETNEEVVTGTKQNEQKVVSQERQKVEASVPKEVEEQMGALKDEMLVKESLKHHQPKMEYSAVNLPEDAGRQFGSEEGEEPLPVFNSPVISSVVDQADLPKGSDAQDALRFQLGSLIRPELSGETAANQGVGRSTGSLVSGGMAEISSSGEKGKTSAETKKAAAKELPRGEQEKVVEKVKELLKDANATRNGNTMVVRLDPPKLGAMTVRVTHRSGQVFARIIPESQEVEVALRGRIAELTQVLSATGIKAENVHISLGAERSESELYQFNEFLNQNGGHQSEEHGFTRHQSENHATLSAEHGLRNGGGMAADAGWIA